jgi:uncharacterized membrane protein
MIGIILEIASAILTAAGVLLQKIGLKKVKKWKDVLKSKKWMIGYLLFAPAFILYALALKYERLSIIQPLGNLSLIALVILEIIFLKEKVKKHEFFAFALFFIGVILIGV